jgi:rod shape determining protein RodA
MGHIGMGAQRWLKFGGMNIQPSEFMKIATILALARYYHSLHSEDIPRLKYMVPALLMLALPAVLILRQPNLGTTTILVSVGIIMMFMAGIHMRYFVGAGVGLLASLPVAWHFLHDYQKQRVLTFLDPASDPLGAGYNILQSMIAIGSGGILGKGFLDGSQGQLNFLPEKHTDFIFTMFAEEWGFLGSFLLVGMYGLLLLMGTVIASRSRSTFGALLATGVTAMVFVHVFINMAMVMGLIPVVGVPLPFLSYGGSNMISILLAMGLLLNACRNMEKPLLLEKLL